MSDVIGVLFVLFVLFAHGLPVPMKKMKARHIHQSEQYDRPITPRAVSNPSTVTVLEANEPSRDGDLLEDIETNHDLKTEPKLNKVKERSLVKILNQSKTPRYKSRETLMESDLFSTITRDAVSQNVTKFLELYPSGQGYRNENFVAAIPGVPNNKNTSASNTPAAHNKNEFVYTYLPITSLANGSEIELIKNTILRSEMRTNGVQSREKMSIERVSGRKNVKHQVRKYFRLHSSVARDLEEKSELTHPPHSVSPGSVGPGVQWLPVGNTDTNKSGTTVSPSTKPLDVTNAKTQAPRMQSIVLRWNLILV